MDAQGWARTLTAAVGRVIYGKEQVIEKLLVTLLCRGHALLEDVPGVGKTVLARALSTCLGGEFRRIQCTPDLLPADVLGGSVYHARTGRFEFRQGPIMTNILLVDEINRATPRTQSALLEAMSEGQISVEGDTTALPDPFFMLATENPVEFEGTFPLPEAQRDRFFLTLRMGYPSPEAEQEILHAQRRLTHPVTDLEAATDLDDGARPAAAGGRDHRGAGHRGTDPRSGGAHPARRPARLRRLAARLDGAVPGRPGAGRHPRQGRRAAQTRCASWRPPSC